MSNNGKFQAQEWLSVSGELSIGLSAVGSLGWRAEQPEATCRPGHQQPMNQ